MNIVKRRLRIMEILKQNSYVTVDSFAQQLDVTPVTIRSDLTDLEQKGLLLRTHGGAMITEQRDQPRLLINTINEHEKEKRNIALTASKLIEDGTTIIIDSGSTTFHMAEFIKDKHVTVITNSLLIINELSSCSNVEVMPLGGSLLKQYMSITGPLAVSQISQLHADAYFMGSGAYTDEKISVSNLMEAELKKAMMKASDRVVVLADSSKYQKYEFAQVSTWADIDTFITDKISSEFADKLHCMGVETIHC